MKLLTLSLLVLSFSHNAYAENKIANLKVRTQSTTISVAQQNQDYGLSMQASADLLNQLAGAYNVDGAHALGLISKFTLTRSEPLDTRLITNFIAGEKTFGACKVGAFGEKNEIMGLRANHDYAVLSMREQLGTLYISLGSMWANPKFVEIECPTSIVNFSTDLKDAESALDGLFEIRK